MKEKPAPKRSNLKQQLNTLLERLEGKRPLGQQKIMDNLLGSMHQTAAACGVAAADLSLRIVQKQDIVAIFYFHKQVLLKEISAAELLTGLLGPASVFFGVETSFTRRVQAYLKMLSQATKEPVDTIHIGISPGRDSLIVHAFCQDRYLQGIAIESLVKHFSP